MSNKCCIFAAEMNKHHYIMPQIYVISDVPVMCFAPDSGRVNPAPKHPSPSHGV